MNENPELHQITPKPRLRIYSNLEGSEPAKYRALTARRHFVDALVQRDAVALNSFASVRGQSMASWKATPRRSTSSKPAMFRPFDTSHVIGLRDRALLGILAYTGVRIGAVAKLHLSDSRNPGEQRAKRAVGLLTQGASDATAFSCGAFE